MSEKKYQMEIDELAIGLTKSPMFMGINMRVFFANVMLCTLICIDLNTFMGVPLFLVLHLTALKFSIDEPNFIYIFWKSFFMTPPTLNYQFWGKTNSYQVR